MSRYQRYKSREMDRRVDELKYQQLIDNGEYERIEKSNLRSYNRESYSFVYLLLVTLLLIVLTIFIVGKYNVSSTTSEGGADSTQPGKVYIDNSKR